MMRSFFRSIALSLALVLATSGAMVSAQKNLKVEGEAHLMTSEVDDDGKTRVRLVEPVKVVPGDRILFTTNFANEGGLPVTNFVVTNPIPDAVQLAAETDPNLIVSIDGGKNWGRLRDLKVTEETGSRRPARHSDVTHLRWVIARIAPNERGQVKYIASVR